MGPLSGGDVAVGFNNRDLGQCSVVALSRAHVCACACVSAGQVVLPVWHSLAACVCRCVLDLSSVHVT